MPSDVAGRLKVSIVLLLQSMAIVSLSVTVVPPTGKTSAYLLTPAQSR
jgi:hypothetical protein